MTSPHDHSATSPTPPPHERGVFCNRTLNLRSIGAIGYDMDYTLIHYDIEAWERRAYEHLRQRLADAGWPVGGLEFEKDLSIRGLVIDLELGNVVKANRFGYVKRAFHGTRPLEFEEQRRTYARTVVDLAEPRWVFLNTLFSLSEACMLAQLVDLLDARALPEVLGYADLYRRVKRALDQTHMEGQLKAEIIANPDAYVRADPELPLALLDQKAAGKKLMVITNSEWGYTSAMMAYAFDRFLPGGMTWRGLFDVVIVGAQKPDFFLHSSPLFEVVSDDGLLRPTVRGLEPGKAYLGGHVGLVERMLGLSGDEILYVGDHIYTDVHVSKSVRRWRTALILRELEEEMRVTEAARADERRLNDLMGDKERLEQQHCAARVALARLRAGHGPKPTEDDAAIAHRVSSLRAEIAALDETIAPLARAQSELCSPRWGLMLWAGNDKSHLARQLERHADIYTSRVSNFLFPTPYAYFRSPRGSLPHDVSPSRENGGL
jgi:HAD superfamily 5'-nucleotidase-like hydrolase